MGESEATETVSFLQSIVNEIIRSPLNLALVAVSVTAFFSYG